ncbi:DUF3299 domain-containing protein [Saccharospirillum mangrovi]|uniref:DUF3299 domain-containing protein n=1 Tax=Saccharospirillum mangrovi TaxID=2161747 RepID=UPI000D3574BA|nr:DUF3299 domain-containing protein [Saccharospirillum mangrovi]
MRTAWALIALFWAALASAESRPVQDLPWEALIPAGFSYADLAAQIEAPTAPLSSLADDDPEAQRLYSAMRDALAQAPVVDAYDGLSVRIAGFVVPLEQDEDRVLSFLLVPYYGACIHTPPPPANQIIHVETQGGFKTPGLDEPVYVTGTLRTERHDADLGSAGYTLYAGSMTPYL